MDNKIGLLLVDDDLQFRRLLVETFRDCNFTMHLAESAEDALPIVQEEKLHVGIIDIILPGMNGIELIKRIHEINPAIKLIMLTGEGSVEGATESMQYGAFDYLQKPFSLFELEQKILDAYKSIISREGSDRRKMRAGADHTKVSRRSIIGESPEINTIRDMIQRIAGSESTVIIEGESGTGKDIVANVVHQNSSRGKGPFIAINCGAMPENLLENELFGHEKGAFTDATSQKRGLFEVAAGGTLFIDEIGEMSHALQVKLLRVLETEEFRRLGGTMLIKTDARIIAATNKNLHEAMEKGDFRKDLYYRLNVFTVTMPPLRQHWRDIPLLVEHFLGSERARKISPVRKWIDSEAMKILIGYDWPGNVRELFNMLERAIVLTPGDVIISSTLPLSVTDSRSEKIVGDRSTAFKTLKEAEKEHIRLVLKKTNGNKNKAAQILAISRQRLYRKIQEYSL